MRQYICLPLNRLITRGAITTAANSTPVRHNYKYLNVRTLLTPTIRVHIFVLTTQQNKSARGWAMQFYKYAAAMLLESHGGEGGNEIPPVCCLFFYSFVLFSFRFLFFFLFFLFLFFSFSILFVFYSFRFLLFFRLSFFSSNDYQIHKEVQLLFCLIFN